MAIENDIDPSEVPSQDETSKKVKKVEKTPQDIWPWVPKKGFNALSQKRQRIWKYSKVTIADSPVDLKRSALFGCIMEDDYTFNVEWHPLIFQEKKIDLVVGVKTQPIPFNKELKTVANWKKLLLDFKKFPDTEISECFDPNWNTGSFCVTVYEPKIWHAIDALIGNVMKKETDEWINSIQTGSPDF